MKKLVNEDGVIDFGIYKDKINTVNYKDYNIETPMGGKISGLFKHLRFKQFHFIGVLGPDIMAGLAVIDLKYLTNGFFYVYDRQADRLTETKIIAPFFSAKIKPDPSNMDSVFSFGKLKISFKGNTVSARGKGIDMQAVLDFKSANPLRICTRAGYRGWVYTEKTTPVPLSGHITCNGKTWDISSPKHMALVDWSAGFMRRETYWNWASMAATLPDGKTLGLNLACGVNETAFTENAFWLDQTLTKTDTVNFIHNAQDLMKPWTVRSADKKIDLEFRPANKREEKTNAYAVATRFTQLMGCYSGTLTTDSGETIIISDVPGYAEDHYARW
ncbi:MAG: DUF2804 domain-containing protein [Desulfobacteraceae bacterium]|jgi:hypothetical protein